MCMYIYIHSNGTQSISYHQQQWKKEAEGKNRMEWYNNSWISRVKPFKLFSLFLPRVFSFSPPLSHSLSITVLLFTTGAFFLFMLALFLFLKRFFVSISIFIFSPAVGCYYFVFGWANSFFFTYIHWERWRKFHRSLFSSFRPHCSDIFLPLSLDFYYYNNVIAIYPAKWAYTNEALQMDMVYTRNGDKEKKGKLGGELKGSKGRWGRRLRAFVCVCVRKQMLLKWNRNAWKAKAHTNGTKGSDSQHYYTRKEWASERNTHTHTHTQQIYNITHEITKKRSS